MIVEGKKPIGREYFIKVFYTKERKKATIRVDKIEEVVNEVKSHVKDEVIKNELERIKVIIIFATEIISLNNGEIKLYFDWQSLGKREAQFTIIGHGHLYKALKKIVIKK